VEAGCTIQYRARNPRATPLFRLFEHHFEEVRGQWEERFERRFGFWRGFVDEQVLRYLDCGLYENGFARIRCPECAEEYLLAFSCKTRELCPSCAARRATLVVGLFPALLGVGLLCTLSVEWSIAPRVQPTLMRGALPHRVSHRTETVCIPPETLPAEIPHGCGSGR
jgi:hypothetical protein